MSAPVTFPMPYDPENFQAFVWALIQDHGYLFGSAVADAREAFGLGRVRGWTYPTAHNSVTAKQNQARSA